MRLSAAISLSASAALFTCPSISQAQIGALTIDCKASGFNRGRSAYQFVATCPGRATSPNRRLVIVQRRYSDRQPPIEVQDAAGRTLSRLSRISDDMPFVVLWSPDSQWFAVNHHVGSFMDELHLFEVVGRKIVERPAVVKAAKQEAVRRYPCLSSGAVLPSAMRWSKDSRRLTLVTVSSLYACSETAKRGDWWPLWMIADIGTGRIDPASIRVDKGDGPLREPNDTRYRNF